MKIRTVWGGVVTTVKALLNVTGAILIAYLLLIATSFIWLIDYPFAPFISVDGRTDTNGWHETEFVGEFWPNLVLVVALTAVVLLVAGLRRRQRQRQTAGTG